MEPARVTVLLVPGDLQRFVRFVAGYRRTMKQRLVLFAISSLTVAAYVFLMPGGGESRREPNTLYRFYPVGLIVLGGGVYAWAHLRLRRRSFWERHTPGALVANTYEVREAGLHCESERGEVLNRWMAVERLVETDEYLYVMLAERQGHVLPKRCFPSLEAAASFASQVRLHLEKQAPPALAGR